MCTVVRYTVMRAPLFRNLSGGARAVSIGPHEPMPDAVLSLTQDPGNSTNIRPTYWHWTYAIRPRRPPTPYSARCPPLSVHQRGSGHCATILTRHSFDTSCRGYVRDSGSGFRGRPHSGRPQGICRQQHSTPT